MALYAGEAVGQITSIVSAAERVEAIVSEARILLEDKQVDQDYEDQALASPVCYARDADDHYAGYATRDELLNFLNELLEAERAGARITARTASEATDPRMKLLMCDIQRGEAHWCAMLLKWIGHLKGEPSPRVGAFYEKCLAIPDLGERVAFINRSQAWVVRKLREAIPKTRDDAMHADFVAMLKSHEKNISRVNDELSASAQGSTEARGLNDVS